MLSSRFAMLLLLTAGVLAGAVGCATVGETNRKQFILLSSSQEMQLGLTSFDQLKKQTPASKDAAAAALLQKVGKRIAAVANLPEAQWEFVLFESKEPNAFCLPGGKVGVYTGILPITRDEAGLATVVGHEVAHAYARHGGERMTHALVLNGLGDVLDASLSGTKYHPAVMTAYGLGSQVGIELPFSRAQESEADRIGLRYMARAGYDPEAAIAFWTRFAEHNRQAGASQTPGFLRTHPLDETRIRQLQEWLPEAKAQRQPPK